MTRWQYLIKALILLHWTMFKRLLCPFALFSALFQLPETFHIELRKGVPVSISAFSLLVENTWQIF
jgi:hypothetical protein